AFRYRRTDFALAAEETAHVPPIFAQQALGVVFRVPLEMDKKTSILPLHEAIDAGLDRSGENGIPAVRQSPLGHAVPSRVGRSENRRKAAHQGVISGLGLMKDADAFGRQRLAFHTVDMQDGS